MELEDRYVTSTPEGVPLSFVLAGVGSRGAAYLIDFVIQTVFDIAVYVTLVATVSSSTSAYVAAGIYALVYFVVTFGYFVLFETFDSGRSLGKRALGIKVTRLNGSGVTFRASLVRNLLRILYVFPLFYLVDAALIIGSRRNQRLGDFFAGTLVLRERTGDARPAASTAAAAAGAWGDPRVWSSPGPYPGWLPPELASWDVTAVTQADLVAVHAYLARRFQFDPAARRGLAEDLANRLLPRVAGPTPSMDPERFLEAVALVKSARG